MCDLCFHCTAYYSLQENVQCPLRSILIVCYSYCVLLSWFDVCVSMGHGTLRYLEGQVFHYVQFMRSISYHIRNGAKDRSYQLLLFVLSDDQWCRELHRGTYTQGVYKYECLPMCRQVDSRRRQYIIDRRLNNTHTQWRRISLLYIIRPDSVCSGTPTHALLPITKPFTICSWNFTFFCTSAINICILC